MENYRIEIESGKASIYTPYNIDFVSRIKNAGGRWDAQKKCWTVPEAAVDTVRSIMMDVYGRTDDCPSDTVKVRLTIASDLSEPRSDVCLLGHTLCHAYGRDSGGRSGDDVFYESGEPISGGSAKNWRSTVPAGSVIVLGAVPRAMLDKAEMPEDVTMEIVCDNKPDLIALKEEKDRLLARIAEIDKILCE